MGEPIERPFTPFSMNNLLKFPSTAIEKVRHTLCLLPTHFDPASPRFSLWQRETKAAVRTSLSALGIKVLHTAALAEETGSAQPRWDLRMLYSMHG